MEDIEKLHNLNLEWGCITNLMDKISGIEDKIDGGWPELIDMIADAVSEEGEMKSDPAELFFNLYQFLFRFYYRIKNNPSKRVFNQVSRVDISGKEYFRITNYDYNTFKWAKNNGFGISMSNDYIDCLVDNLNEKQRRHFERRCN